MTTSKISTLDGIKHYYQWAKCLQMWSWKDCANQNYRIMFSIRRSWLCTIKKLLEKMENRIINDWRQLKNFIMIRWWELETSGFGAMLWNEDQSPRVRKERKPTWRGKCVVEGVGQRQKGRSSSPAPHSKSKQWRWKRQQRGKFWQEKSDCVPIQKLWKPVV